MSASVLDGILDASTLRVTGLGLSDPKTGNLIPVVKRKAPSKREGLDAATQITIFRSDQAEQVQYAAFGKQFWTYLVIVAVLAPGNQDLASNLDWYSKWREKIKGVFLPSSFQQPPPIWPDVPQVFDVRVKPDSFLPRELMSVNYDYQALGVSFTGLG